MNKHQLLRYVGHHSQVFGIREYTLDGGKAKGVKAFDVCNGSGLEFTVLASRCLDIAGLSFKGVNCSYIGKPGIVAPEYYESYGTGFLRNFFAGFLTTCGLRNVGNPCEVGGEPLSMHGRISNTPAGDICVSTDWTDDAVVMTLAGKMSEARVFGENLLLTRRIECRYGENSIWIRNRVENMGFAREPLMLLFHFNLGYPLLNEDSVLLIPSKNILPRDPEAAKGIHSWQQMQPPTPGYAEQVFYHDLKTDVEGNTCVALVNRRLELAVAFHFSKKQFFNFTQWKQMGEGEYVLGLEPCNCYVGGRTDSRNIDVLQYIEPGESRDFDLKVEIVSGISELQTLEKEIQAL